MFSVEGQRLIFSNGRQHTFPTLIAEVLDFEEVLVARLSDDPACPSNENVFAFHRLGDFLWQIPARSTRYGNSPYVSISRGQEYLEAYNWDGRTMTLNPLTGEVVGERYQGGGDAQSHRIPSRRNWI